MRIAAGILMIIGGWIGGSMWLRIVRELMSDFAHSVIQVMPDAASVAVVLGGVTVLVGLLPMGLTLLGGIYALRRKHWRLALAGSICSAFVFPFLGIPAVILLIKRKDEFKQKTDDLKRLK